MATVAKTARTLTPYKRSVDEFARMIEGGYFVVRPRVELLGGRLVEVMTRNEAHDHAVDVLGDLFHLLLPPGWIVREVKSLVLNRYWRAEPDFAVVRGERRDYRGRMPRAADLALIVEVSESSYAKDRGVMWRRYAASKIATYWLVNTRERRVEVYTNPDGRGESAGYADCVMHGDAAEVPVIVEGREVGRVAVRDLLP